MPGPFLEVLKEEEFFSKIRDRIACVISKRIHSEDSEDVIQSAMVEIRSRIQEFKEGSDLLPLVCEVLRNSIREYYQQKKREEKVLEFSPDAMYYYQPEIGSEGWQEIAKKGITQLKEEQPQHAELMNAILQSSNIKSLSQRMKVEKLNLYRMMSRCRISLLKIVTENLKISLP